MQTETNGLVCINLINPPIIKPHISPCLPSTLVTVPLPARQLCDLGPHADQGFVGGVNYIIVKITGINTNHIIYYNKQKSVLIVLPHPVVSKWRV